MRCSRQRVRAKSPAWRCSIAWPASLRGQRPHPPESLWNLHSDKARKVLLELPQDPAGREFLRNLGISGFTDKGEERLRKLLEWLGV